MSNEIQNQAIELSADELDVVAGGAAQLDEKALFSFEATGLASVLKVGPTGVTSLSSASGLDIFSAAEKQLGVF
jgi:predicted secreted protein